MDRDELTVRVEVPAQLVDPTLLERFAKAIKDLTAGTGGHTWSFTNLEINSLDTAARPVVVSDRDAERALDGLAHGLAELEAGRLPAAWSREALIAIETLEELGPRVIVGVGSRFEQRPITRIANGARSLLKVERRSIGSVEGVIDSVSLRGSSRRFGILDASSGQPVQVNFGQHFESSVLAFFHDRRRIVARGPLFRDAAGSKRRLTLETLRALDPPTNLTVNDIVGTLGTLPDGIDSITWIRRQRD